MSKDPVSKTNDVRAAVDAELGFDPLVDAADITVRNIAGDVTLTGTVPSYPQYLQAAAAARRVAGVTGVHNHLQVALPDSNYRDDVKLATAANNALAANVTVPDSVEATAEDGNITLTGTASYGTERAAAEAAVAGLAGIRNVSNDIEISYALDPVEVDLHAAADGGPAGELLRDRPQQRGQLRRAGLRASPEHRHPERLPAVGALRRPHRGRAVPPGSRRGLRLPRGSPDARQPAVRRRAQLGGVPAGHGRRPGPGPHGRHPNVPLPGKTGPGGGRIGAVLLSPLIRPGTVSAVDYSHYSLLRTIEDIFGLPHLGDAAMPQVRSFGPDVFG
jgi:osmotically-inducible protein OsmY